MTTHIEPIVRRFVEDAGNMTQSFGLGRVVGQIYAFVYFSPEPQALADLQEGLGISKGSASMGVRQLEQWGAVRKIWVKGDRKDYYQANDWFGQILKSAVLDTMGKKMTAYGQMLKEIHAELQEQRGNGNNNGGEAYSKFLEERIGKLQSFQAKTEQIWNNPLLKALLK